MRTSKKFDSKDVCVKENIDLFQKLKKVSYIDKIREINKVDTRKLNKRRFLFNIRVLSTS